VTRARGIGRRDADARQHRDLALAVQRAQRRHLRVQRVGDGLGRRRQVVGVERGACRGDIALEHRERAAAREGAQIGVLPVLRERHDRVETVAAAVLQDRHEDGVGRRIRLQRAHEQRHRHRRCGRSAQESPP
jgi:hypothetical protein